MPNVARIGDIVVGTCCCHSDPTCRPFSGVVATGAGTVIAEGAPVSKIGDIAVGCHSGVIATGIPTVLVESVPVATINSVVVGCVTGIVVTGAATVMAGG